MFKLYKKHINKILRSKKNGNCAFVLISGKTLRIIEREAEEGLLKSGVYYTFVEHIDDKKVKVLSCCKTSFSHAVAARELIEGGHNAFVDFPCFLKLDKDVLKYDEIVPSVRKMSGCEGCEKAFAVLGLCFV